MFQGGERRGREGKGREGKGREGGEGKGGGGGEGRGGEGRGGEGRGGEGRGGEGRGGEGRGGEGKGREETGREGRELPEGKGREHDILKSWTCYSVTWLSPGHAAVWPDFAGSAAKIEVPMPFGAHDEMFYVLHRIGCHIHKKEMHARDCHSKFSPKMSPFR